MTKEECAWLAGFYEGEGSCCSSRNKQSSKTVSIGLNIAQKDTETLERVKKIVGFGSIYLTSSGVSVYRVRSFERVQYIVAHMWPWLSVRRKAQIKACFMALKSNTPFKKHEGSVKAAAEFRSEGLSQRAIGKKLGVDGSTVSRWLQEFDVAMGEEF